LGFFSLTCSCGCPLKVRTEAMWDRHTVKHQMRRAA
jgi:hypothetical protein